MKSAQKLIAANLITAGLLASGAGWAGDTQTVAVSATVVGNCKFNSGGSVSFTLDPASTSNATGTVTQPTFFCTKGATYSIADDVGLNESGTIFRMTNGAAVAEFIPYSFTYTATGTGTGKNAPITLNIASTVNNADFVDASAGSYTDTVTLTINP